MDPFHERLARIALDEAGAFGFALAGGYAVQAHGFLQRFSSDIDLFAEASAGFELGLDWRKNEPIHLAVGPVLHADDAVANKVCALFGRAEVRDYVDVDAILTSGRYTEDQLLGLAADHDPGFDHARFAEALAAIDRLPDSLFRPYGMSPDDTSALRERMRAWARRVSTAP
jgi:hypothetical protein